MSSALPSSLRPRNLNPSPERASLTRQDASSDRDVTGKRAFLVNVGALDGLKGSGRERGGQQVVPENRGCGPRETNYNSQQPSEELFRGGQGDSAWAHVQGDRGRESFF